jgi:hypothetical protein
MPLADAPAEDPAFPVHLQKHDQDWLLQELVKYANHWDINFSVTLNLGGSMVSGTLISAHAYIDEFAVKFRDIFEHLIMFVPQNSAIPAESNLSGWLSY